MAASAIEGNTVMATPVAGSAEELVYRIDTFLDDADLADDFRTGSLISVSFCDLLRDSLDERQKEAVEAARDYLIGSDPKRREIYLSEFGQRIGDDMRQDAEPRKAAMNRLVWCSLVINTGFSGLAAEFILSLGSDAGLTIQEMRGVFFEHIPRIYSRSVDQ